MAGHSRSKNGVASLAYVPAIPVIRRDHASLSEMRGTSPRMTEYLIEAASSGVRHAAARQADADAAAAALAKHECREPEVRTHQAANAVANFGFTSGTR